LFLKSLSKATFIAMNKLELDPVIRSSCDSIGLL
jgi:hypothetical protein